MDSFRLLSERAPASRLFIRRLIAGALLLNLLVIAMMVFSLQQSRARYHAQAFVTTSNLAQLLEQELTASFDQLDQLLLEAKAEFEKLPAEAAARRVALEALRSRPTFHRPELDALRVADANGVLLLGSGASPTQPARIADRAFFIRLQGDPTAGLVFSEVLLSRASGKPVLVLARRLNRSNGEFAGMVSASISLAHLQKSFEALNLGSKGAVSLRDQELRLIARHSMLPGGEADLGSNKVSAGLLKAIQAHPDHGNFLATTLLDQIERANAYRKVSNYPFYVLVGLASEDFLAAWRWEAGKTLLLTLAFVVASLLFCWQNYRAWSRREQDVESQAQQERKFRTLLESAPDALVMVDARGLIAIVNCQAEILFGYPREELVGQPIEMLVPMHRRGNHESHRQKYIAQPHQRGMGNVSDLCALRKDGTEFPVEISLSPIDTEQGQLVMAAIRDVTERQRANTSLRESEERFRLVVEGVQDYAIFMLSPEGIVLNWNAGAERVKQWRAEEIVGRHFSVFYLPEDLAAGKPMQHLEMAARLGHFRVEDRRVRKDGSVYWASLAVTAIHDDAGKLRGFAKLTRDITERKRYEQQELARRNILDMIVAKAPLPALLAVVAEGVEAQLPGAVCAILLRDVFGTRFVVGAAPHLPPAWLDVFAGSEIGGHTCYGTAASQGQRVVVPDIAGTPACADCCGSLSAPSGLAAIWSEPVLAADGETLGVLVVCHRQVATPAEFELSVLGHAAQLASIAIERSRSDEALELAASVYAAIGEAIMLVDADNHIEAVNPAFTRLTGYFTEEIRGKNPSLLSSGIQDRAFYQRMWHSLETTGRWQGEICNRHKDGDVFTEWLMITSVYDDQGKVRRRIALFSDCTDQKRAEEAVWRQANYDPLTLLPNRRLFQDRLEQEFKKAARSEHGLAILLIDLDHFKEVNDTLGHDAGDVLLVDAARRIQNCVRDTDTVARLGGDEFSIIMSGIDTPDSVAMVAAAVVETLARPFQIGPESVRVAGSVGIALFPGDAPDSGCLVRNADRAMYAAKHAGRGCFRFYLPDNAIKS